MTPRYMLDTNICIYLMKHHPPEVAAHFGDCFAGEVVMSAITYAELEFGVAASGANRAQNEAALADLIQDIPVAPFDARAGKAYGPVREASRERTRDALDKLIAAHAIGLDCLLVTNNPSDFKAYPGLNIENWVGK